MFGIVPSPVSNHKGLKKRGTSKNKDLLMYVAWSIHYMIDSYNTSDMKKNGFNRGQLLSFGFINSNWMICAVNNFQKCHLLKIEGS